MLKIGQIRDLDVFLEAVPAKDLETLYFQVGVSCQVRVVKGPDTPFTLQDTIEHKIYCPDILGVLERTDRNEAGRHFLPGFMNYQFHGGGFRSNDDNQFVLTFTIRPVHAPFE